MTNERSECKPDRAQSSNAVSRREFMIGAALVVIGQRDLPIITKRVEKLYTIDGCKQPNDLQFTSEGLWVLDQVDQPGNKVFLVKPDTGSGIKELMTESMNGSGLTYGNSALSITWTK